MPPATSADVDLFRDIHKAIRSELFAVTAAAGRCDPSDPADRADVAAHVAATIGLVEGHGHHEDTHAVPALMALRPDLADRIATDHLELHRSAAELVALAGSLRDDPRVDRRRAAHRLYLDLAAFTGAYLTHQDLEERAVMPLLVAALGPRACLELHQQIVASMPADERVRGLAVMVPALNVDERTELLEGLRAGLPAAAFADLWSVAASVLPDADRSALAARLGL